MDRPPLEFDAPATPEEAQVRVADLLARIEDITRQLLDPTRTDPFWQRRAKVAQAMKRHEVEFLRAWLARHFGQQLRECVGCNRLSPESATDDELARDGWALCRTQHRTAGWLQVLLCPECAVDIHGAISGYLARSRTA
jgi:hypothetical protein